jgi:hypothetical protein
MNYEKTKKDDREKCVLIFIAIALIIAFLCMFTIVSLQITIRTKEERIENLEQRLSAAIKAERNARDAAAIASIDGGAK